MTTWPLTFNWAGRSLCRCHWNAEKNYHKRSNHFRFLRNSPLQRLRKNKWTRNRFNSPLRLVLLHFMLAHNDHATGNNWIISICSWFAWTCGVSKFARWDHSKFKWAEAEFVKCSATKNSFLKKHTQPCSIFVPNWAKISNHFWPKTCCQIHKCSTIFVPANRTNEIENGKETPRW